MSIAAKRTWTKNNYKLNNLICLSCTKDFVLWKWWKWSISCRLGLHCSVKEWIIQVELGLIRESKLSWIFHEPPALLLSFAAALPSPINLLNQKLLKSAAPSNRLRKIYRVHRAFSGGLCRGTSTSRRYKVSRVKSERKGGRDSIYLSGKNVSYTKKKTTKSQNKMKHTVPRYAWHKETV